MNVFTSRTSTVSCLILHNRKPAAHELLWIDVDWMCFGSSVSLVQSLTAEHGAFPQHFMMLVHSELNLEEQHRHTYALSHLRTEVWFFWMWSNWSILTEHVAWASLTFTKLICFVTKPLKWWMSRDESWCNCFDTDTCFGSPYWSKTVLIPYWCRFLTSGKSPIV